MQSMVDESGPDAFEDKSTLISTKLILTSLERVEGPAFVDCEAEELEVHHPCDDDDINRHLGWNDCGGGSGNLKLRGIWGTGG